MFYGHKDFVYALFFDTLISLFQPIINISMEGIYSPLDSLRCWKQVYIEHGDMNDVLENTYLFLAINLCFENCCICLGHTISLLWSLLLVASLQICLGKLKTNIYVNSRVVSGICQSTNCLSKGWGLKPWKLMSLSPTSRLVVFFFLRHLLLLKALSCPIAYLFHNSNKWWLSFIQLSPCIVHVALW